VRGLRQAAAPFGGLLATAQHWLARLPNQLYRVGSSAGAVMPGGQPLDSRCLRAPRRDPRIVMRRTRVLDLVNKRRFW